jgi:CheY-like chemotaxis protein
MQQQPFIQLEEQGAGKSRPLVLVIEDHPATQHVISAVLHLQGYQPICAINGQDALEWLEDAQVREEYPAAILLDLLMPVMDGIHFLSCLRAQWQAPVPLPPTILLTAYAGNHDTLNCTQILQKPFHVKDLLERIKQVSHQG